MSLVSKFTSGLRNIKLNQLPAYTKTYAQENLQPAQLRSRTETNLEAYRKKYIETGSPQPLYDVLLYGFFFSYLIAWPQEYKHYKAEQEAKLKGEAHH